MEPQAPNDVHHSKGEFNNLWVSQGLMREWVSHPAWNSYDVLPCLYRSLHTGERFTPGEPDSPKLSEILRTSEARLTGSPEDLLPEPSRLYLLTTEFSDKLDQVLRQAPKTIEQAIHDAAFSYYVFDRIHPFPDGNGRIGRMILKRVLKAANLKDPIFHDQRWYGGDRSFHLDTLERVDDTNNLAHLELFLADALIHMYDPVKEGQKYRQIGEVIQRKDRESKQNGRSKMLKDIWAGFMGIPLYGNPLLSLPRQRA